MKRFTVITLSIVAMALTVTLAANDKVREQKLQQAIDLIESRGDLAKATPLLEDVAKSSDRALAARGLLQLAQARERFGQDDAVATYRRIVAEFGEARETASTAAIVAAARTRVAALEQKDAGSSVRQVWEQSAVTRFERGGVSPDGRYLTFIDWDAGNVAVHELSTNRDRVLTTDAARRSGSYGEISVPSPDGRFIAYNWRSANGRQPAELRVIPQGGGRPLVVYANKENAQNVVPFAWSPDGRSILASVEIDPRSNNLVWIPAAGGPSRLIKALGGRHGSGFKISPDGRSVIYASRASEGRGEWDLYSLSLATGAEVSMRPHPADDYPLGWFPDGNRILFVSDRGGSYGIWAARVTNGIAPAEPVLIRPNTGPVEGLGFTRNGDFFYRLVEQESDVYLASLDSATGRLAGRLARLEGRFVGGKTGAAWSPTGDRIAYVQTTGAAPNLNERLAVQTASTGQITLLPLALDDLWNPVWVPDGTGLLIIGADTAGKWAWYRVNAETGALSKLLAGGPPPVGGPPALSSDGQRMFFVAMGRSPLYSWDLSGTTRTAMTAADFTGVSNVALSPNGQWIAVSRRVNAQPSLDLVPAAGGEPRHLASDVSGWDQRDAVAWSRDNRYVFAVKRPDGGRICEVWRVPVDGTAPRDTGIRWSGLIRGLSVHPDGRLALSTDQELARTWVLQNLPAMKDK